MTKNCRDLLRLTKCRTVYELAHKVGVNDKTVTSWCSDNRTPRKYIMVRMAKATKTKLVDLIHFFYYEVDNEKENS